MLVLASPSVLLIVVAIVVGEAAVDALVLEAQAGGRSGD
jgi:hypothetical protein